MIKITEMRILLVRIHKVLLKLDPRVILVGCLLMAALFGYVDYLTGFEISFSLFYLIPIAIAAWYVNARSGLMLIAVSIVAWLVSNWLAGETYTHEIIRYFNALTRLAVFLLVNELLYELKLVVSHEHRQSRTDHLTGISNSREFYDQATLELERSRRYGRPFSVAYLDLDDFKSINDTLGHSEGDRLLKSVAQTVDGIIRKTDVFARLGGDEFVILFPNTDQSGAKSAMGKIETALNKRALEMVPPVTLSIGVITFHSVPVTVDRMLRQADHAMYQAKSHGKDQTFYMQVGSTSNVEVKGG